jgi:hypothetical protein
VFTLLSRLYHQIVRQLEVHNRLRWYIDIAVAGQSCSCGPSATTDQAAYEQTCASGGQATH